MGKGNPPLQRRKGERKSRRQPCRNVSGSGGLFTALSGTSRGSTYSRDGGANQQPFSKREYLNCILRAVSHSRIRMNQVHLRGGWGVGSGAQT